MSSSATVFNRFMDYFRFLTWINRVLFHLVGGEGRPTFFGIDETFPALNRVTDAYAVIKAEFDALVAGSIDMPAYHEIDPAEAAISNATEHRWNVFLLHILGAEVSENKRLCPRTCEIVSRVPGVVQAFFSILDPGKSVPRHRGPYYGYLRYHLGLQVPVHNPPCFRINDQDYCWAEGEPLLFDDSWPHEVINTSEQPRAVLIVDVMRPMPAIGAILNKLAVIVARHTYAKAVLERVDAYNSRQVLSFFNAISGQYARGK